MLNIFYVVAYIFIEKEMLKMVWFHKQVWLWEEKKKNVCLSD